MQQTDKYKLNLIDTGDDFSPNPLNKNMKTLETQLARVDAALAAKAAQTALAALTAQVAALEKGQLRYKFDSYTGDGTAGTTNPTRLEFDFKPLLLIIATPGSSTYGGRPWIRGTTVGTTVRMEAGSVHYVTLTWKDRAVEWVNFSASHPASYRLNINGTIYPYLAIGISE